MGAGNRARTAGLLVLLTALAPAGASADPLPEGEPFGEVREALEALEVAGELLADPALPQPGAAGEGVSSAGSSAPAFLHYPAPAFLPFAHRAGETSIGFNAKTGNAMFLMGLTTARVRWDDATFPPAASWEDVSFPTTATISFDPILWTDRATGRTFVVQLLLPCSSAAFTDDDGATWVPTQLPCSAPSFDHETLGGGPYPTPLPGGAGYPSALYYCAQGLVLAQCARSDDGGLNWGPPLLMNLFQCSGKLHGQVQVGPDGAVYVPHKSCGGQQGLLVSTDLGTTWAVRRVPGTEPSLSDPVLAFDAAGRLYFGASSRGRPVVATSPDRGLTWTPTVDVGAPFGIQNTRFPMLVAGDAGRAAFAFYGTTTPGDDQRADFQGEWHLYVAFTFDAGATWETVDTTPRDPVQRGCIWMQGGGNPCRNLLDFQGATLDAEGRLLVGYADGCTSAECIGPGGTPLDSRDSLGAIARQVTGKRLLAAFDPPGPEALRAHAGGPYRAELGQAVPLSAIAVGGVGPYAFAWDLNADGAFGDATGDTASFSSPLGGVFPVAVRVTDAEGRMADAGSVVRVRDPALEALAAAWDFDAAPDCTATEGWSHPGPGGLEETSAASWHPRPHKAESGPCAWYHGFDALGRYRPLQGSNLLSPCLELPASLAAARFEFRVAGKTDFGDDFLTVRTAPCGATTLSPPLATLTGPVGDLAAEPPSYASASADLTDLIGTGPFRVVLRFTSNAFLEDVGYQVDSFRLFTQDFTQD